MISDTKVLLILGVLRLIHLNGGGSGTLRIVRHLDLSLANLDRRSVVLANPISFLIWLVI